MTQRSDASAKVLNAIVERWSPRSFDASAIPDDDLAVIFEAAGWAPSAFNVQPWRFLYAHRDDANWERFLSLLLESNQQWAKNASVLVFVLSDTLRRTENGETTPNRCHSFDSGAAWVLAAVQATAMGYHAHGMAGVKYDEARKELAVPDDYRIEAAFAIGRKAPKERLPEGLQEKEHPNGRKPVSDFAFAGNFR